jgi:hypothetical protein
LGNSGFEFNVCCVFHLIRIKLMKNAFKMSRVRMSAVSVLALSVAFLGGCGGDDDNGGGPVEEAVSGVVAQGAVDGAVVFADGLDAGTPFKLDPAEEPYSATTGSDGSYSFAAPPYDYQIVSIGGTDTVTGDEAMSMAAPKGSANTSAKKNVTPLTTVVALTPEEDREAVIQTIKDLGVDSYDVDISANDATTPAATAFVQSVQSAVTTVTNALNTASGTGLTTTSKSSIQTQVLKEVAAQVKGSSAADLQNATTLGTKLATAASTAVTNMSNDSTLAGGATVNVGDSNAVAQAVSTAASTVATNVLQSAADQGVSATAKTSEKTVVSAAVVASNKTATNTGSATVSGEVTVTAPANTAPTISGTPGAATVGTAYSFTPTGTDAEGDSLVWTITGSLPAGLTFNKATGKISGTPTAAGTSAVTISASDGVASSATLTVTIKVNAATTGGGGTAG